MKLAGHSSSTSVQDCRVSFGYHAADQRGELPGLACLQQSGKLIRARPCSATLTGISTTFDHFAGHAHHECLVMLLMLQLA